MKQFITTLLLCISIICKAQTETLTNKSIIDLSKAGLTKQIIISKIETSSCKFDLSTDGLIALKKANINDDIIQAMMSKEKPKTAATNHGQKATNQQPNTTNPQRGNADRKNIPTPESINEVNVCYKPANTIKPLEKARATMKTKSKMLGYGGTKTLYSIDGATSSFRLSASDSVSFVVNTGGAAPDFILYKLETDKKTRSAVGGTVKMGKVEGASGVITYTTTQIKNGVYQLTLSTKLEKGEYFFGTAPTLAASTMDVYAFGID